MKKFVCQVCESEYEAARSSSKYCSNRCRQAAKYARVREDYFTIKCHQCGVDVFTNDKRLRYCSIECRVIAKILRN